MSEKDTIELTPLFEPDWAPLASALGKKHCKHWMFMASYRLQNGIMVHTYKHINSREYINLSDDGRTWKYDKGGYIEVDRQQTLETTRKMMAEYS